MNDKETALLGIFDGESVPMEVESTSSGGRRIVVVEGKGTVRVSSAVDSEVGDLKSDDMNFVNGTEVKGTLNATLYCTDIKPS
ncbi:hypothetical protein [Lysinibacter cavernae]|uniref:Uncharacterized protein n=1 Tax=Lysinibacter cavernae TaxID=1640652 RepID=A0A7X5R075_9MICO|nr:hypothetical protein [Lysinibacter cavernae]NIH53264.1 hypothetical protein [Lysinibacter cavernae]